LLSQVATPLAILLLAHNFTLQLHFSYIQVRELRRQITLEELKSHKAGALYTMVLFTTPSLHQPPTRT
jgi:hypothetical protein